MLFMMILTVAMSLSLCLTHINGMVTTKAIAMPLWVCDGEWSSTTSLVNWLLTSGPSAFFVIIGEHNKD